jgi:hypothetical protein
MGARVAKRAAALEKSYGCMTFSTRLGESAAIGSEACRHRLQSQLRHAAGAVAKVACTLSRGASGSVRHTNWYG